MYNMKTRLRAALCIPMILAALTAAGLVAGFRVVREAKLEISGADGRLLVSLALPDARFDHVFIHSIHLTPVEERFRIVPDERGRAELRLFELRYQSLGVGMPSDAEGGFRLEDGHFILTMDRVFKKIPVMVSVVSGHGVVAGGIFHPFTEWVKPEDLIFLTGKIVTKLESRR